jgi:hypothetical protein
MDFGVEWTIPLLIGLAQILTVHETLSRWGAFRISRISD